MGKINLIGKKPLFNQNSFLIYFIIFVISFLFFFSFQQAMSFPDPDSFYHAKMAVLIKDGGIVKDFPYLQYTVLKDYYTDHHLLYHILLVPFIWFLKPLIGLKLATTFFAAVFITIFYWFLKENKIKGACFYVLLLFFTRSFVLRLSLAKAPSLSLVFLILGLYFIFRRKNLALFALSFFYVWLYGGWPLILVAVGFYILSSSIVSKKGFLKGFFSKKNLQMVFSCTAGLFAGIVINPYFPKNLYFYWQQIIKIAVLNYQRVIGVGAEWYPYGLIDLLTGNFVIFILLILSSFLLLLLFLYKKKLNLKLENKDVIKLLSLLLFVALFFVLTLKSRRNIEYFIPFAVLFTAFSISFFVKTTKRFEKFYQDFISWFKNRKFLLVPLLVFVLFILSMLIKDIIDLEKYFYSKKQFSIDKYKYAALWLEKNTERGSIVFHNDWDDFPFLFYYNHHNYYIVGLDPTFMYEYNEDLYWKWVDITTGKGEDGLYEIIKHDLNSDYVFVDSDHTKLKFNLFKDNHFKVVYQDDESTIFELID